MDLVTGAPEIDVDETVVSNADYQETLRFAPYSRYGHFDWMRNHEATPIRGAVQLIDAARAAGVDTRAWS